MGVAIFADLALEGGGERRGGSNHCGITALSLTEKVHSRLPVKRLRQTAEQRTERRDVGCVVALECWTVVSLLANDSRIQSGVRK